MVKSILSILNTLQDLVEYKELNIELLQYDPPERYHEYDIDLNVITRFFCHLFVKCPFKTKMIIDHEATNQNKYLSIEVFNIVDLEFQEEIKNTLHPSIQYSESKTHIKFLFEHKQVNSINSITSHQQNRQFILPWYNEIRKQLTSYFKSPKNLEKVAESSNNKYSKELKRLNQLIYLHIDNENLTTSLIAFEMTMSVPKLYRICKAVTQKSPAQYIRYVRLMQAKHYLETGDWTISEVISKVGFVSNSHFTKVFKKQFGFKPSNILKDLNEIS